MAGVAADLAVRHDELNRLDAAAGDGDLGNTVTIAARAVRAAVDEAGDDADPATLLRQCGTEVANAAPSTTGTLTARGMLGAAKAVSAAGTQSPVRLVYLGFAAALAAIQTAGKAAPGDKTLIDALGPAVAALSEHADAGARLPDALSAAAAAARLGAEQTKDMTAKAGRARWLAERSQGAEDAGARFVALVLESAASRMHEQRAAPDPGREDSNTPRQIS
jgi:dihydroxyacetone kinase